MTNCTASEGHDTDTAGRADGNSVANVTPAASLDTRPEIANEANQTISGSLVEQKIREAVRELDPATRLKWTKRTDSQEIEAFFSLDDIHEFYFCRQHGIFLLWAETKLDCDETCMWTLPFNDWSENRAVTQDNDNYYDWPENRATTLGNDNYNEWDYVEEEMNARQGINDDVWAAIWDQAHTP